MRRKDRERDAAFAWEVFNKVPFITVSMTKPDGSPYAVPLSLAASDEQTLYFHCASEGEKNDYISHNPMVYLSAVTKCRPVLNAKNNDFTLEYKSATAVGKAEFVTDRQEKIKALRLICERFLPQHMDVFDAAVARSLDRTAIVKITLREPPVGKQRLTPGV